MKNLLITKSKKYNYNRRNNKYIENNKIGDEKLWKIYIKKYVL